MADARRTSQVDVPIQVVKRKRGNPDQVVADESWTADATTAAWMLTVVQTLLCELGTAAARWYASAVPGATRIALLANLLLIAATVIGGVSLMLLPLMLKLRRVPPPRGILVFGVIVGAAPLLGWLVRLLG